MATASGTQMIPGYTHTPGNHCGSTALRNLLAFHGCELTEEMAFGLGAGACFFYIPLDGQSPSRFTNGRAARLEENFLELTGAPLRLRTEKDPERSWELAREDVDAALDHLRDGQLELAGKIVVALVVPSLHDTKIVEALPKARAAAADDGPKEPAPTAPPAAEAPVQIAHSALVGIDVKGLLAGAAFVCLSTSALFTATFSMSSASSFGASFMRPRSSSFGVMSIRRRSSSGTWASS